MSGVDLTGFLTADEGLSDDDAPVGEVQDATEDDAETQDTPDVDAADEADADALDVTDDADDEADDEDMSEAASAGPAALETQLREERERAQRDLNGLRSSLDRQIQQRTTELAQTRAEYEDTQQALQAVLTQLAEYDEEAANALWRGLQEQRSRTQQRVRVEQSEQAVRDEQRTVWYDKWNQAEGNAFVDPNDTELLHYYRTGQRDLYRLRFENLRLKAEQESLRATPPARRRASTPAPSAAPTTPAAQRVERTRQLEQTRGKQPLGSKRGSTVRKGPRSIDNIDERSFGRDLKKLGF